MVEEASIETVPEGSEASIGEPNILSSHTQRIETEEGYFSLPEEEITKEEDEHFGFFDDAAS